MPKISQINYSIQFEPIFSKFTFNGTQVITLNTSSTNSFTLNAAELKITKCYLMYKGKSINTKFKSFGIGKEKNSCFNDSSTFNPKFYKR